MTSNSLYLTAEEAAAALGVSVNSLYAYVSRKGIRTKAVPGKKTRLYWHEDIYRLAKQPRLTSSAGPDASLVSTTSITLLTEAGPFYRGRSSIAMSETETIEATAAHLWQVREADVFGDRLPAVPATFADARKAFAGLTTADQAVGLFPLIENANARSYDLSPAGYAATGAQIMRWFAALLVGAAAPSSEPIHSFIAARMNAAPGWDDIVRRLLVLFADHELAPATYAVRAAANAGVTPYQAASVGLNVGRGRRMLAGRTYSVRRLVNEIVDSADPTSPILRRFRDGEALLGFGDGVYPSLDARSLSLMNALEARFGDDKAVARLLSAMRTAKEVLNVEPDFVIPYVFVERQLGFPDNDGALAATGRLAGWIAHAAEQYHGGEMARFRAAYVGELPTEK